jgi:hypothetical protein
MWLSKDEDRWVPRLTGDGEPGNPAMIPKRGRSVPSQGNRRREKKRTRELDGGGFIEVHFFRGARK